LEKFRKLFKKALTLSQERKLRNNNKIFTSLSLYVIYGIIYYLCGIAVKLGMNT